MAVTRAGLPQNSSLVKPDGRTMNTDGEPDLNKKKKNQQTKTTKTKQTKNQPPTKQLDEAARWVSRSPFHLTYLELELPVQ